MNFNEKIMLRCIELAKLGLGNVAPNPIVGCIITYNGKIIGEGYHQKFGGPHAEVNALNSVKNKDLLKNSTLFVTLEPCSHYGKTPPCVNLISEMQIKNVVISCSDPNPVVSGNGIKFLRNNNINVITNVMESKYSWVNRRFFTFHTKKRPYIILKWAKTSDGFIDINRTNQKASVNWITNEHCRTLVHKWRTENQAILIGTKTAINDNPELTSRNFYGNNPLRIIIDRKLMLQNNLKIFNNKANTIIITEKDNNNIMQNVKYLKINFDQNLEENILTELYKLSVQSVIIEGGAYTLNKFISKNLWDEARIFTGNKKFYNGLPSPVLSGKLIYNELISDSKLEIYKRE